jgi:small subunit ribosomal protein S1
VRGRLVSIDAEHGVVDFGGRSEGVIEIRHLQYPSGAARHGVGDTLDLYVVSAGDQVVLAPSVRARPSTAAVQRIRDAQAAGTPVAGHVTARNAGGLEIDLSGVRGFCPLSQIESGFCADPSVYVGRTLEFLVTEIRSGRRGAVVSRRALLRREEEAAAHRLLESLKPGDELEGTVTRLEAFGAFVNLGGVDGLVHVSEIRHERTGHPSQALSVGQQVRVKVLRLERGKDGRPRIALSIKAAAPDPWKDIEQRFPRGTRVTGTVARLTDFGAFVNLAPGIDGLVHVSESAPHPVAHVREVMSPGQVVEAVVLGADAAKRRISLSVRATLAPESAPPPRARQRPETARPRAPQRPEEPPQTTMGIALRKAMEKAREKRGES